MSRAAAFIFVSAAASAMAGCASTGATPRPFPTPVPSTTSAVPAGQPAGRAPRPAAGHAGGYEVAGTALSLRGAPYRNGGSDPAGFDCSGFVRYVFEQNGIAVPRTVTDQYHAGKLLDQSPLWASHYSQYVGQDVWNLYSQWSYLHTDRTILAPGLPNPPQETLQYNEYFGADHGYAVDRAGGVNRSNAARPRRVRAPPQRDGAAR